MTSSICGIGALEIVLPIKGCVPVPGQLGKHSTFLLCGVERLCRPTPHIFSLPPEGSFLLANQLKTVYNKLEKQKEFPGCNHDE
jgi:hypothetical protein